MRTMMAVPPGARTEPSSITASQFDAAITDHKTISLRRNAAYRHGLADVEVGEILAARPMPPVQHDRTHQNRTKEHKHKNQQIAPNPEAGQGGEEGGGGGGGKIEGAGMQLDQRGQQGKDEENPLHRRTLFTGIHRVMALFRLRLPLSTDFGNANSSRGASRARQAGGPPGHDAANYPHARRRSYRGLVFRFEKCAIVLILAAPPCAAMAINGVEISSSDPGAVPGASTQARY